MPCRKAQEEEKLSDVMMISIATMPYELAMSDELSHQQFYANTQRLVAVLEAARAEWDTLREALSVLVNWTPSAETYRRLGFDPETPMRAHEAAKAALAKGNKA